LGILIFLFIKFCFDPICQAGQGAGFIVLPSWNALCLLSTVGKPGWENHDHNLHHVYMDADE
jgi:hypothetical protein